MRPDVEKLLRAAMTTVWSEMESDTERLRAEGRPGTTIKIVTAESDGRPGRVAAAAIFLVGEDESEAAVDAVDRAMRALADRRNGPPLVYSGVGSVEIGSDPDAPLVVAVEPGDGEFADLQTARAAARALTGSAKPTGDES